MGGGNTDTVAGCGTTLVADGSNGLMLAGCPGGSGVPTGNNGGPQEIPEGSWICLACHHVNFPKRDSCNKRLCGKPRIEVDGGPPPGMPGAAVTNKRELPQPDGTWTCVHCGNTNWPLRTTCNKKKCGMPRDA